MKIYTTSSYVTAEPMTWGGFCHVQNITPHDHPRSEAHGYSICLVVGCYAWMRTADFEHHYKEMKP